MTKLRDKPRTFSAGRMSTLTPCFGRVYFGYKTRFLITKRYLTKAGIIPIVRGLKQEKGKEMKTTLSAVFLVIVASFAATGDQKEAEVQDAHYCEMVALYKESGGEYGWPAYKGNRQC